MPTHVPTPVAAALGLVPAVLDGVRQLPVRALQLPVYVLTTALTSYGTARREYDALALRGERLIAQLRGTSLDELEDRLEDVLQGTPLATPYDRLEDGLEDAGDKIAALVGAVPSSLSKAGAAVVDAADDVDTVGGAAKEEPKGVPTPKATQPDSTRIATAASPDVVETVERLTARIGGTVVEHDELPLPDYDHMTLGSLRGRMRSLDLPQLIVLRDYEKAHADRLPIVTMLDNRIAKLASDPTAPLSGGGPTSTAAVDRPARKGRTKVTPQTAAPASATAAPQVSFGGLGGATQPD